MIRMSKVRNPPSLVADSMLDPRVIDPDQELVDFSAMDGWVFNAGDYPAPQ